MSVDHTAKFLVKETAATNNRIERRNGIPREDKTLGGWKSKRIQIAEEQKISHNFVNRNRIGLKKGKEELKQRIE